MLTANSLEKTEVQLAPTKTAVLESAVAALPMIKWLTRHSRNAADEAADVYDETVQKLLDLHARRGALLNKSYAKRTARSVFHSRKREEMRRKEVTCDDSLFERPSNEYPRDFKGQQQWNGRPLSTGFTHHREVLKHRDLTTLCAAIDRLSPPCRQIIEMFYYRKLRRKEVGRLLGISPQTASRRRKDAELELKQQFHDYLRNFA